MPLPSWGGGRGLPLAGVGGAAALLSGSLCGCGTPLPMGGWARQTPPPGSSDPQSLALRRSLGQERRKPLPGWDAVERPAPLPTLSDPALLALTALSVWGSLASPQHPLWPKACAHRQRPSIQLGQHLPPSGLDTEG